MMNPDAALLALISDLYAQAMTFRAENEQLKAKLEAKPENPPESGSPAD